MAEDQPEGTRDLARRRHDLRRQAGAPGGQEEPRPLSAAAPERGPPSPSARRVRQGRAVGTRRHPARHARRTSAWRAGSPSRKDCRSGWLGQDRHHLAAGQRSRVFRRGDGDHRLSGRRLHRDPVCTSRFSSYVLAVAALAYWLHRSWQLCRFRRRRLPLHRQSRLLAGDGGDDFARRLRDAGERRHRRAGRHRLGAPALALCAAAAAARPDADAADFRLSDPDPRAVSSRRCAGPDLDRDLRHRRADPPDPSRHRLGAAAAQGSRRRVRRDEAAIAVESGTALSRCRRSWPASRNASC